jgi:hypothetical protein
LQVQSADVVMYASSGYEIVNTVIKDVLVCQLEFLDYSVQIFSFFFLGILVRDVDRRDKYRIVAHLEDWKLDSDPLR